jgi:tRNA A37 methylthiotransferase MiaB
MFRIDDVHLLPKILKYLNYDIKNEEIKKLENYIDLLPSVANQTENENISTAYVPISTGCNQFCSYCIVPFAR